MEPHEPHPYFCRIPVGDADAQTVAAYTEQINQLSEATERNVSGFLLEERHLVFQCLATHHKDLVPLADAIFRSLRKILQVNVPTDETTPLERLKGASMFG